MHSPTRALMWITVLPLALCLAIIAVGALLSQSGPTSGGRPDELAVLPAEIASFAFMQLTSTGLLMLAGYATGQERILAVMASSMAVMLGISQWGWLLNRHEEESGAMTLALLLGLLTGGVTVFAMLPLVRPLAQGPGALTVIGELFDVVQLADVPWWGHTRVPATLRWAPALAILPFTAAILWSFTVHGSRLVILAGLVVVGLVLLQVLLRARVSVDGEGVLVRGFGAIVWVRIPVSELVSAEVIADIDPLREFGGWGLRPGFDGSRGLVTASGPGVRIDRVNQSPLVITVERPAEAAAAINTWVRRPAL